MIFFQYFKDKMITFYKIFTELIIHYFGHLLRNGSNFPEKYFANNSFMQISFMRSCYNTRQKYFP